MKYLLFFAPILDISGMVLDYLAAKDISVDVRIYFGRCDGLVSEHALNGAQIGSTFQQMSGK